MKFKRTILSVAVQYACYAIGEEFNQRQQRETVWGHLRRS